MKGLLVKDFRLVLKRKQQLLILLVVCAMIAFTSDGSFVVAYAAGLAGILGLSTYAFDEHDNGFPFLFSLPVDAGTYVKEKYLFCVLCDLAGLAAGTALFFAACATTGKMDAFRDGLVYLPAYFPATLVLILSVLLVQMKFGIERSRLVTLLLYGCLFVLSAVFVKIVGPLDGTRVAGQLPEWMKSDWFIVAGIYAIAAIACAVLFALSLRVMKNREY